jgi:serine/threonine protein phosphatase 1
MITCAVGDIHGCIDQLRQLVELVRTENKIDRWVFLGDYIDRGPGSKEVIDLLMSLQQETDVVCLKGNHEAMLIEAVEDDSDLDLWLVNGGFATLQSFDLADAFALTAKYLDWLGSLPLYHDDGRRFFVHAGVNQTPPHKTPAEVMLWIRDPFLTSDRDWGRLIVHGHTPGMAVTTTPYRVNLDTACVYGGKLTAALFSDDQAGPYKFHEVGGLRRSADHSRRGNGETRR